MRESAETFELPLVRGEDLGGMRYSFALTGSERVAAGTVAVLKSPRGEQRVVIERVADDRVVLVAETAIDEPCALVIAPWFLYDRLIAALDDVGDAPLALTLFGKQAPARIARELRCDHGALDASQRAAVQLC